MGSACHRGRVATYVQRRPPRWSQAVAERRWEIVIPCPPAALKLQQVQGQGEGQEQGQVWKGHLRQRDSGRRLA
eukprot:9646971-Heterocapsa_arctica.AAC.1